MSDKALFQREISAGTIVDGCFRVLELGSSGGMGLVYRAEDLSRNKADVAIKVLPPIAEPSLDALDRFSREAEVLAALRHPGIVAYVAHGRTEDHRPYLAMEWIDGESLADLLARQRRLSPIEAITLLGALADALAFAHERGIMHRDLKPANVLLREGKLEKAAIVDFGVARWSGRTAQMTRTGMLIGTPGYMAPEQARGKLDIGPAADVFALGCIFFECLTGKAPFAADHIATVLTKILFEEVPPVRALAPETPEALETLVARMLAKEPEARPKDARALCEEIKALPKDLEASGVRSSPSQSRKMLTDGELMLFSLVLATPPPEETDVPSRPPSSSTVRTPFATEKELPMRALANLGAQVEYLADGSVAVILGKTGSARDQVASAARAALLIEARNPMADVILVTGRGVLGRRTRVPEGEVFSRASALLARRATMMGSVTRGVWLDDVSASLLGADYRVAREEGMALLVRADAKGTETGEGRPLLGRTIPCMGREREIGQLLSMLDGAVEEESSAAVVLLGPAGAGKSRLLHEFLRRVRADRNEILVIEGRGDPGSAASPHGLIGRMLRDLAGVRSDDDAAEQRRKLVARLSRHLPAELALKTVLPLVELAGAAEDPAPQSESRSTPLPTPDPQSSEARRIETRLSGAVTSWLGAECAAHPVLLAIEDLHWADVPSVRLVDAALRASHEMALFVLGLQRTTADGQAPTPWHGRAQEIRLGGLGKKAAERIVLLSLGEATPPETVTRIVQQAAGNPLFLEELVRAEAAGQREGAPETVLAILQARIQHLSPGARRALRSASLFGNTFWRGGIAYLVGLDKTTEASTVELWLEELVEAEIIERHTESRFAGDQEYVFRNGLVREAAYGLLTEDDRKLGHALAGLYLEQAGERDAAVLAGHTYEIVQWLERKHNSFFVSRLTMLTGISLRKFTRATPDDPATLKKLRRALGQLLRSDEIAEVKHLFKDV